MRCPNATPLISSSSVCPDYAYHANGYAGYAVQINSPNISHLYSRLLSTWLAEGHEANNVEVEQSQENESEGYIQMRD